MFYSDDPVRDFENHDRQQARKLRELQARKLRELPICVDCDEPISDNFCYEINGEYICQWCMDSLHRKDVGDCV